MSQLPQHYKVKPVQRSQRRIASYLALVLGVGLTAYTFIGRFSEIPAIKDFNKLNDFDGIREDSLDLQPASTNMIQISDLPSKYLPETGKHRTSGRLVIVGDVHGMKKSLVALLHKVKFDEKYDHLIFTGDMISKGPDSTGVVDLAMELGATSVRGNHEDRIILEHAKMAAKEASADQPTSNNGADKVQDGLGEKEELSRAENKDRALVKALGEKRIGWLEKCPVILRIGKLGSLGNVLVVHAGLVPGIELEKQDPSLVMTMRTIGEDGVPTEDRTGQAWMKEWNKYQKTLPKQERSTVIYGHDSKRGLQDEKYNIGIDTNCVKGGKLTAMVIEGGHSGHSYELVHIGCEDSTP